MACWLGVDIGTGGTRALLVDGTGRVLAGFTAPQGFGDATLRDKRPDAIELLGGIPDPGVLPAADWAMQGFGRRVYLVGTDGLFPHRANAMLRDFIRLSGGQVLGERYVPLTSTDVSAVSPGNGSSAIKVARPV